MQGHPRLVGAGLVTAIGGSVAETWRAALDGRSGLAEFDGGGCLVARVDTGSQTDKLYTITAQALAECLAEAGWDTLGDDTALILSTGSPDNVLIAEEVERLERSNRVRPDAIYRSMFSYVGAKLSQQFHVKGPVITAAAACAGSSHALQIAHSMLASGAVKRCLVGGAEIVSDYTVEAFKHMRFVLSTQTQLGSACIMPFGADRSGIALGEGCGWLALESGSEGALEDEAILLADTLSLNAPDAAYGDITEPGDWARLFADTPSEGIDLVYAHATSTPKGDRAEGKAIASAFADAQVRSSKYLFGHTLSASTIVDLVMMRQSMLHGELPGLGHRYAIDEELQGLALRAEAMRMPITRAVKLSAAFGGAMGKVVLARAS